MTNFRSIVICLCFSAALAHVKIVDGAHSLHSSVGKFPVSRLHSGDAAGDKQGFLQHTALATEQQEPEALPKHLKGQCTYMLAVLGFLCCCSGALQAVVGQEHGAQIGSFISCFMFFYLLFSGIYGAYWRGEDVGIYCKIMCWWVIFQLVVFSCIACLFCAGIGAALVIKNEYIKKMRAEYEEKMADISGPRRDYYESALFKEKCQRLFEKADVDGSGTLEMHELRDVLVEVTKDDNITQITPLLTEAFDQNNNNSVEKDEFVEMMKFVSVVSLQPGKFTVEQAFEILQLPETATILEVNKAYRKMAIKYHPDKAGGNRSDEAAKKDMAEINDAKAKVEEYLKLKEG